MNFRDLMILAEGKSASTPIINAYKRVLKFWLKGDRFTENFDSTIASAIESSPDKKKELLQFKKEHKQLIKKLTSKMKELEGLLK